MAVPITETTNTAPTRANNLPLADSGIGSQPGKLGGKGLPSRTWSITSLVAAGGTSLRLVPTESVSKARAIEPRWPRRIP